MQRFSFPTRASPMLSSALRNRSMPSSFHVARSPAALRYGSSKTDPNNPSAGVPDSLAEGGARGRTGGGKPLESSRNAPPQPKINNASVPGQGEGLTEEQKKEVEEHNKDFEKKHGKGEQAADDKVDKKFWSGGSGERDAGT